MSNTRNTRNKKRKGQEQVWKGFKNGFGKGQKRVLSGIKKQSRQIREYRKGENSPAASFHIFPSLFPPSRPFFHPFSTILAKKGKKRCQKIEERERKRKAFFPVSFLFPFFIFPSRHTSRFHHLGEADG